MIIFLYGQDDYRLIQKLQEIEKQFRQVHGNALNLEKINVGQIGFQVFWDSFSQQSIFVKKKLFFLENVFSNANFEKNLLDHIEDVVKSPDVIVIIEKSEPAKASEPFKALLAQAKTQHFEELTGIKLRNWAKKEFSKYNAEIQLNALEKLLTACRSDLWNLTSQIKKLSSYKSSTRKVLVEDVDLFVKPKIDPEIFKTIDALAQGNKKQALQFLQAHLDKGDSPFYLLTMIAYQFRNIILVKAGKKSGMHPFVLRKTGYLAARFSFDQLKRIFNQILDADLKIKTGVVLPDSGLKTLIANI